MADSNTTTYSFTLPEVGASADSWGTKLNANWDKVDDLLDGSIAVNGITVTGGSIDGTPVGATTPSTGAFTTLTTTGNVDVTGTVTADGLKSSDNIEIATSSIFGQGLGYAGNTSSAGAGTMALYDATTGGVVIDGFAPSYLADSGVILKQSGVKGFHLKNNNDVHLYEDTGTTAKMTWDASAESLGIGTNAGTVGNINTRKDDDADVIGVYISNESTGASASSTYWNGAQGNNFYITTYGDGHARSNETWLGSTAGSSEIVFSPNNTERMRITSSGFVGINDTAPQTRLSVRTHYSYNGNSNGAIKIGNYQGNDSDSYIQGYLENISATRMVHGAKYYGGGNSLADSATTGSTSVSLASDHIAFTTNTGLTGGSSFKPTERARIDSSGNLLVGKTSSAFDNTAGIGQFPSGRIYVTRDGGNCLYLNRVTSDGDIAAFYKDGTTVGSIGSGGSNTVYIGGGDTGLLFAPATNIISPWNTSTNLANNGNLDLGYSGGRFKDLYLSGGVYLGGTGSANKLDDYEEGVWIPTTDSGTITNSGAAYTKIGNTVSLIISDAQFSDRATSETLKIKNLPFPSNEDCVGSVMAARVDNADDWDVCFLANYTTELKFYRNTTGGFVANNRIGLSANNSLYIQITYTTDS